MTSIRIISIILSLAFCFSLNAQENSTSRLPISVSYWGYHIFHPGLKIGTQYHLKNWNKNKAHRNGDLLKHKTLFLNPELEIYLHAKNHTGLLLNTNLGIEVSKNERKFYKSYSLGLGYIRQFNAGTTYVLEEDDSISDKSGASRGYIMPAFNYEYGQHFSSFSWFNRFTLASKMKYNTGISAELFFEAGLKFYPF